MYESSSSSFEVSIENDVDYSFFWVSVFGGVSTSTVKADKSSSSSDLLFETVCTFATGASTFGAGVSGAVKVDTSICGIDDLGFA